MSFKMLCCSIAGLLVICQTAFAGFDRFSGLNENGQNVYEFLGISSPPSKADLGGVRKRMIELHPQNNPQGEVEFKALSEAMALIKTEENREQYDLVLKGIRPRPKSIVAHQYFGPKESVPPEIRAGLERLNSAHLQGSGTVLVARLDQFENEFNNSELNLVRTELKRIFAKEVLNIPEWAYVASILTEPEILKSTFIVVVPEGVDELRGSMTAGVHIHAFNGEFTTFYNGHDIEPEQANSLQSRERASHKYTTEYGQEFRNSYILYVKPSTLKEMGMEMGASHVIASTLAHELTHVADIELLKRWSAHNRVRVEMGKSAQPFYNLVAKVHAGQTFLSSGFYNMFLESRGYYISALIEEKLGPVSSAVMEKYWLQTERQLEEVRGWLLSDSMGFLSKMEIDFLQIPHRSLKGEAKVRAIGNKVFSSEGVGFKMATSLLKGRVDCELVLGNAVRLRQ